MAGLSDANFYSWLAQILTIGTLGALLPLVLKIERPRLRLLYCHALLVVCLLLPLIQTWQYPLVLLNGSVRLASPAVPAHVSWPGTFLSVLIGGFVARSLWLAGGLVQLRRYRRRSLPLQPIPQPILEARAMTRSDALFRISEDVGGPATLGHVDPVVLLPPSFLTLDHSAQRAIACHELLHVQRRDWLVTVLEEIAAALMWFHPGVWLLLAQARLSREQIVDAEVVHLTNAPASYVSALLSSAGAPAPSRLAVPANLFLAKRQLPERLRSLLNETRPSNLTVTVRCGAIAVALICAAWAVFGMFPLTGEAQVVSIAGAPPPPALRISSITTTEGRTTTESRQSSSVPEVSAPEVHAPSDLEDPTPIVHRNVFFFRLAGAAATAGEVLFPPPRPPPQPPNAGPAPPVILLVPGLAAVRSMRPGQAVADEEIERVLETLGSSQFVEIMKDSEGRISKVLIGRISGRRVADENDVNFFDGSVHPVEPDLVPGTTDGID